MSATRSTRLRLRLDFLHRAFRVPIDFLSLRRAGMPACKDDQFHADLNTYQATASTVSFKTHYGKLMVKQAAASRQEKCGDGVERSPGRSVIPAGPPDTPRIVRLLVHPIIGRYSAKSTSSSTIRIRYRHWLDSVSYPDTPSTWHSRVRHSSAPLCRFLSEVST